MKMKTAWLEEMNWMEAEQAFKDANGIAIIPIGCLEQWGHMPVGCDTYQAMGHVKKVVELAQKDKEIKQIVVLPMVPHGCQPYMADFPGTVHIPHDVLREYYRAIVKSLMRFGVMKFIWISGHSGNAPPLIELGRDLKAEYGVLTVLEQCWKTRSEYGAPQRPGAPRGGHGSGGLPLSELSPEILKRAAAQAKTWFPEKHKIYGWEGTDDFVEPGFFHDLGMLQAKLKTSLSSQGKPMSVLMCGSWHEQAPYGNIGEPSITDADVEESRRGLEIAAKHTIAIIKAITKIKVPLAKSKPTRDIEKLP